LFLRRGPHGSGALENLEKAIKLHKTTKRNQTFLGVLYLFALFALVHFLGAAAHSAQHHAVHVLIVMDHVLKRFKALQNTP
jgi:hypothetical protein